MRHIPVMVPEVLHFLAPKSGGTYFDATVGGGGHAEAILEASEPDGVLLGCDRDPYQLTIARARLSRFGDRVRLFRGGYERADLMLAEAHFENLDGFLIDCGASMDQLSPEGEVGRGRGFSWRRDEPLLMTYDPESPRTAAALLRELSAEELRAVFRPGLRASEVGPVVRAIIRRRRTRPIETTGELVEVLRSVFGPESLKSDRRIAAAFAALRSAVNEEYEALHQGMLTAVRLLKPGGMLVIITFQGSEVRVVLQTARALRGGPSGPPRLAGAPELPPQVELLTGRGLAVSESEARSNPAARSARLHALRKL